MWQRTPYTTTCIPERIQFRLCSGLPLCARHSASLPSRQYRAHYRRPSTRRRLRYTDTMTLQVPPTRRFTLGDRAFPVAAA